MTHQRRILVVDDDPTTTEPVCRWLEETPLGLTVNGSGVVVKVARTLEEAKARLLDEHFHTAIVDISLDINNDMNSDGYELLRWIDAQAWLKEVLPCIVLSGQERGDLAMAGMGRLPMKLWIRKKESDQEAVAESEPPTAGALWVDKAAKFKQALLSAVKDVFNGSVGINFDLVFDADSESRLAQIVRHVEWPEGVQRPDEAILIEEVRDLFGKQFHKASQVYFEELTQGLSGAAVVKVRAKYGGDFVPAVVLKVGRRDKVETEYDNYLESVTNHLPTNTAADVKVVYAGHLGALRYKFAEAANKILPEFDAYFRDQGDEQVVAAVRSLFKETCYSWYRKPEAAYDNIFEMYYAAFNLDKAKLVTRIREILPGYDPDARQMQLPEEPEPLPNPLAWLRTNGSRKMRVCKIISHGDMTGRNIFVSDNGHCWLIDFYRTNHSHLLRDFVILETDIKYRLLPKVLLDTGRPTLTWTEYAALEQRLADGSLDEAGLSPEALKALMVLRTVREIAEALLVQHHQYEVNRSWQQLSSLLMAHLNVTRLRHIGDTYKLWALATAGRICAELEHLPPPIL